VGGHGDPATRRAAGPHRGLADAFVASARRDGAPNFTIRPPGRRPVYYVTLYSELASRFGSTLGLDARSTPAVVAAMERARDTGRIAMSAQTTLSVDLVVPRAERPVAFELFVPVYRDGAQTTTVAQRRAAFLGWASGQFRAADFLQAALRDVAPFTGVELYDPEAGPGEPLCVAPIDLDNFKAFNDQHGHQAGDRLLKAAGAAWWANLRKADLLVRYGGEEFAVLLPDCGLDDAMAIAERLRTAQPEGTCSIGVAEWVSNESVDELVRRADQALYAAKAGGRNRCCASPSARTAGAVVEAGG